MSDLDVKNALLQAAKMHVAFDGWTEATFEAAARDAGVDRTVARAACPRGAVDLALAYHAEGDAQMVRRLQETDLSAMRFRDRIAFAVRTRLELVEDKELVRRGLTLFALPHHAADGTKALWATCDLIWDTLGDTSEDVNWYTKRGVLSGVYSATVLFWLGDESDGNAATWDFLDRRIDNVMQFESVKAKVKGSKLLGPLYRAVESIPAPKSARRPMPGHWEG